MKSYTPNSAARFCTEEMKVNTISAFCQDFLGWKAWTNVVGLRYDEGRRVLKMVARNAKGDTAWTSTAPLAEARITKADVSAFWAAQPFDLGLKSYEGNCDLCFLKGRGTLKAIMREQPGAADWWIASEVIGKGQFVTEYSYATLAREVVEQPHFFDEIDNAEADAECGDMCGGDSPAEIAALQAEFERGRE
jgi:3'-phosphoadenosine 5'-phosphosulfate sulfotransferase (PAPS reductase)/FAD synthetase